MPQSLSNGNLADSSVSFVTCLLVHVKEAGDDMGSDYEVQGNKTFEVLRCFFPLYIENDDT